MQDDKGGRQITMKAAFRVDGNGTLGLGHVMRCLSLADALRNKNTESIFLMSDSSTERIVRERGFQTITLNSKWDDYSTGLDSLLFQLANMDARWVITDSYYTTPQYYRSVHRLCKTAVISEAAPTARMENIDLFINYNIYANNYETQCIPFKCCLGIKYAMLREEFQNVETDTRNYILVLTGGSDPYNIATHLVRELLPLIGEKASIVVVSSSLNPNIEELRMVCNDEKVCLLENVRNMAMVMKHAILAISSGGSTLYELCACGIPTITYAIAPNQMDNVLEFDRLELMKFSGYYPDCPRKVLSSIASSCIVLKNDALRQSVLAIKLRDMCDGAGSLRVAEAIVSM